MMDVQVTKSQNDMTHEMCIGLCQNRVRLVDNDYDYDDDDDDGGGDCEGGDNVSNKFNMMMIRLTMIVI